MVVSESPSIAVGQSNEAGRAAKRRAVNIAGRGSDVAFIIDEDAPMDESDPRSGKTVVREERGAIFPRRSKRQHREAQPHRRGKGRHTPGLRGKLRIDRLALRVDHRGLCRRVGRISRRHLTALPVAICNETLVSSNRGAGPPALTHLAGGSQRNRTQTLLIRSTFRSGESIHHYGDVVVLGDVNPGSEIKADGDIVVMGTLKGMPHAGASKATTRLPSSPWKSHLLAHPNRQLRGSHSGNREKPEEEEEAQAGRRNRAAEHCLHPAGSSLHIALRRAFRQIHERGTL